MGLGEMGNFHFMQRTIGMWVIRIGAGYLFGVTRLLWPSRVRPGRCSTMLSLAIFGQLYRRKEKKNDKTVSLFLGFVTLLDSL